MSRLPIDADALFRAVTAHDYKLLAYYLDLRTGEVVSRTLTPEEVQAPPPGPRVKPLPLLGGDVNERKGEAPFGPPPVAKKADLFKDGGPQKKDTFGGGFWKRDGGKKADPFGGDGHKPESGTKRLAEIFGEKPPEAKGSPFLAKPGGPDKPAAEAPEQEYVAPAIDPNQPLLRIPPASEEQNLDWMRVFSKDSGDPEIREKLLHALNAPKPFPAYERVLRNYQRSKQQWEIYYRRQALHYAEVWLKALPIQWEIVESKEFRGKP